MGLPLGGQSVREKAGRFAHSQAPSAINTGDSMDLEIQIDGGRIKRYHTVPLIGEQSVAEHSYNVVQILRHITKDMLSINLLKAALDHDVLEYFTGDMPYPTKCAYPALYGALKKVEAEIAHELGIDYELTPKEELLLRWADVMEAGMFGDQQLRLGNKHGLEIVENVISYFVVQKDMPHELCDLIDKLAENYDASKR